MNAFWTATLWFLKIAASLSTAACVVILHAAWTDSHQHDTTAQLVSGTFFLTMLLRITLWLAPIVVGRLLVRK